MARILLLGTGNVAQKIFASIRENMDYANRTEFYDLDPRQVDPVIHADRMLGNAQPTTAVVCLTDALEEAGIVTRMAQPLTRFSINVIVSPSAWDTLREHYDPSWCNFVGVIRKVNQVVWNAGDFPPKNYCDYLGDETYLLPRPMKRLARGLDRAVESALYPSSPSTSLPAQIAAD